MRILAVTVRKTGRTIRTGHLIELPVHALLLPQISGTDWEVASLPKDGKSGFISQRHPVLIPKSNNKNLKPHGADNTAGRNKRRVSRVRHTPSQSD